MKRRLLATLLAVCMLLSLFPAAFAADSYEDVPPTHSFYDEITYVSENGLMNGVGDDQFDPAGTTTRAMV
ncbi:MAG: S-layer homology domain-containing protein, partial [Clostridia bacterium]|nr:S-layer homology domain-containing protein [Clostridia bacterium]